MQQLKQPWPRSGYNISVSLFEDTVSIWKILFVDTVCMWNI